VSPERDPPRLRELAADLPPTLSVALRGSPAEEATAADLERVRLAVSARLRTSPPLRPRRPVLSRTLTLAGTFALGAGAGVLVSGGIFLAQRGFDRTTSEGVPVRSDPSQTEQHGTALPVGPSSEPGGTLAAPTAPGTPPAGIRAHPRNAPNGATTLPLASGEPLPLPRPMPSATPDELKLLARAQNALSSDPAFALELTSEHVRAFPSGALAQEREVIAINALLRLDQTAEASVRAATFHRRFPTSAHRRRVDVLFELRGLTKP
jgi:hypothetical protein